MRPFTRTLLFGLLLAVSFNSSALAGKLPATFLDLYRPAIARVQKSYDQLTARGTISVSSPDDDKASEQSFIFRADGPRRRLDLHTISQRNMGLEVGSSTLNIATPIGSFNSYTKPGSQFFDNAWQRKYDGVMAEIDRTCLLHLAYSFGPGKTILDTLQSSAVKITGIKWIRVDGQPMVQITYDETGQYTGQSGLWRSTIVLSPSDGWGLFRFERSLAEGTHKVTQRGVLTYTSSEDGTPSVQSIQVETSQNGRITRREALNVSQITFQQPDDRHFTSFEF